MPSDVRAADGTAAERYEVPSVVLMENAARAAADAAEAMARGDEPFVILAGQGNNGGDGFAAARHLMLRGHCVTVLKTAEDGKRSWTADKTFRRMRKYPGARHPVRNRPGERGLLRAVRPRRGDGDVPRPEEGHGLFSGARSLRQDNNRRHRRPRFKGSSANPGAFLIF